jgi:hypothetical protein
LNFAFAEEQETIIIISVEVGEVIDKEEREHYQLFQQVNGFKSATFLQLVDGSYAAEIAYEKEGEERIYRIILSEADIAVLRDEIENFERKQQTRSDKIMAISQARADARSDVKKLKWFQQGCCWLGLGLFNATNSEIITDESRLLGKSAEYTETYMKIYFEETKDLRKRYALYGCLSTTATIVFISGGCWIAKNIYESF